MERAITELPVQRIFLVGSLENLVVKNAGTINLKASGTVPDPKEDRGTLVKAGPS